MGTNFLNRTSASTQTASMNAATTPNRSEGVRDDQAGLWTKVIFRRVKRRVGRIPLPSRIHARDPKLLLLNSEMSRHLASPGKVPIKLKELAQLKIAAMVGCPF